MMKNKIIAVVGLGYVGLPLAVAFGRQFKTIGFDVSKARIKALESGLDSTCEVDKAELKAAKRLEFTNEVSRLAQADFIVVAVPTPVKEGRLPDFAPLVSASQLIAPHLKKGAIVVYESTVYPGATEDVCVPVLEKCSNKTWKKDFFVGYSPERINPGDKEHTLSSIVKIVSGDTDETLEVVASMYECIINAGVHRASSIKVAEAAKVIENTQRDLNIALMNELALIFHRVGIDTLEVLEAAGTKWNFLPFRPGLVGGHCIGVDPYYLTHKAEMLGYHPQVILAGRRINDNMGEFIAQQTIKKMLSLGIALPAANVVVLGLTFKENCPDLRNSKVADVIAALKEYHVNVHFHDPLADKEEAKREYGVALKSWDELPKADAVILAVAHKDYTDRPFIDFVTKMKSLACFMDIKSTFSIKTLEEHKIAYWRL